jgi:Fis family transcriptional regulator
MSKGESTTADSEKAADSGAFQEHFSEAAVGNSQTLRDSIDSAINNYFSHLDGQMASDVYKLVLSEVEPPLLEAVLRYTRNNQTKASTVLGLNRGTLRKKLKQYDLL